MAHRTRIVRTYRATARGVTLIDVMIVVVIIGLVAGAAAFSVFPPTLRTKRETTEDGAKGLRQAGEAWRASQSGEACPTLEDLKAARLIDRSTATVDAWQNPFKITCTAQELYVRSNGPDAREGTDDDIVAPPNVKTSSESTYMAKPNV